MASNHLASTGPKPIQGEHPYAMHAKIWQHVQGMDPSEHASNADELSYGLPILGALANNPKTTRKDVIKATADAAGAGKIDPSMAVSIIAQMPADPDKLQPWLKSIYAANLSAMVHLKAAMMGSGTAPAQSQPGVPPQ